MYVLYDLKTNEVLATETMSAQAAAQRNQDNPESLQWLPVNRVHRLVNEVKQ